MDTSVHPLIAYLRSPILCRSLACAQLSFAISLAPIAVVLATVAFCAVDSTWRTLRRVTAGQRIVGRGRIGMLHDLGIF